MRGEGEEGKKENEHRDKGQKTKKIAREDTRNMREAAHIDHLRKKKLCERQGLKGGNTMDDQKTYSEHLKPAGKTV